jgi:hypothetical protein
VKTTPHSILRRCWRPPDHPIFPGRSSLLRIPSCPPRPGRSASARAVVDFGRETQKHKEERGSPPDVGEGRPETFLSKTCNLVFSRVFIPPNMTFRRIPRRGAGSSVCFRPAPIARHHRRVLSFSTSPRKFRAYPDKPNWSPRSTRSHHRGVEVPLESTPTEPTSFRKEREAD